MSLFSKRIAILILAILPLGIAAAFGEEQSSPVKFYVRPLQTLGKLSQVTFTPAAPTKFPLTIAWGDGITSPVTPGATSAEHSYKAAGHYEVRVIENSVRDLSKPAAILDYDAVVASDARAFTLPWKRTSNPDRAPRSIDQFTWEGWVRLDSLLQGRVDLLSGVKKDEGAIYIQGGKLFAALFPGATYSQALPASKAAEPQRYVAIVYDRAPTFPYSNTIRFYFDGVLASEQHLDQVDTGSFNLNALQSFDAKNQVSQIRVYDYLLPPNRILAHARARLTPDTTWVTVVARTVEEFTVEKPKITNTVQVTLDPNPEVDNAKTLRAAIKDAKPGTKLQVINSATNKTGGRFFFSSLDGGNDWAVFRIFGKEDFELDGGGAEFIFRTDVRQFYVRDSKRAYLHDFSIDLDQTKFRVGSYARILSIDTATGDTRFQFVNGRDLSPDKTVPTGISMWRWRPHDPKTLRITEGPYFKTGEAFLAKPTRDPADPSILVGKLKPEMIAKLEKYRNGANFLMVNNARFENTSMSLWNCEHVTYERVNYYATLGMVFLSGEVNHVRVAECKIGLPPGQTAADRPLASGADGYHFHDTQGYIQFENNEITLTDDDPITIKDGVYRDITASDPQTLKLKAKAGDTFDFYNWDFSPLQIGVRIAEAKGDEAKLEKPLPEPIPKSFIGLNRQHHTENWILRGNTMHDYYGRLLLCTPHGYVADNVISGSWFHLGASNASFDNAGVSSHVAVLNNHFVHTEADTGIWGSSSDYPVFQGITYAQNSFQGKGLTIRNAGAPLIAGNYFEISKGNDGKTGPPVVFSKCNSPVLGGNSLLQFAGNIFPYATGKDGDKPDAKGNVVVTRAP